MSFSFQQQLPKPFEIKAQYPMTPELVAKKSKVDNQIEKIITNQDDRLLLIVGPCSAHDEQAVLDYCVKLVDLQKKVETHFLLVPRVYTNKPQAKGYKGMLYQPDPNKGSDLIGGLVAIRKLHINILEKTGLGTADQMLYPANHWYLNDVVSYNAVGARSVENQEHRLVASGVGACGMKNPTSGDFSVLLDSIEMAQASQHFIYRGWDVQTEGNPLAHAILRGAVNKHGLHLPNYHYEDLIRLSQAYERRDLVNPAAIIDCHHSNSGGQHLEQIRIAKEVLDNRRYNPQIKRLVKGIMIGSYLVEGCQPVKTAAYGQSITDPCLSWQQTEDLILDLATRL